MPIGEGQNDNRLVDKELFLSAQLSFHNKSVINELQSRPWCPGSPADLTLQSPLTGEQDLEIFDLGVRTHSLSVPDPDPDSASVPC